MLVHCQCGQEFRVLSQRFPWSVKCHVCGKSFAVLDTGKAVDADSAPTNSDWPTNKIIIHEVCQNPSTALEEIDRQWNEFCITSRWQFCGIHLIPSPRKAIAFGIAMSAILFVGIPAIVGQLLSSFHAIGAIFLLLFLFCDRVVEETACLCHEAISYREMQAYFQRLRFEAISKQRDEINLASK